MVDGTYDNLTVNNMLTIGGRNKLNHALYVQSRQNLLDHLYKVGQAPDEYDPNNIPQYISFGNAGDPSSFMFGMTLNDGGSEPVLYWNRAFAARKDIIAGGRLDTQEGVVSMLGGVGWGPDGYDSNPFIWLVGNQHGYPDKDTLEIRISTYSAGWVWTWGNIEAGNFTAHGDLHWSSGAYLTDNQGGSIELGDSSSAESYPFIDFHYGRSTPAEDFNVRLINHQDCILEFNARTSTGGILPATSGSYVLGSPAQHWSYVYADYLRYDNNIATFDAYDDLALVKLWGEKDCDIPESYDSEKVKPPANDPFSILKGTDKEGNIETEFFDVGKTVSFAMGCAKALAKKQDEQDALMLNLLNQVESLRSEIAQTKKP